MTRFDKVIIAVLVSVLLVPFVFMGLLTLLFNESLQCKINNVLRLKGIEPKLNGKNNIKIYRANGALVADFRSLAPAWDLICLTSRHPPDPGISLRNYYPKKEWKILDPVRFTKASVVDKGCWIGSNPNYLSLALWNIKKRTYGEYRIKIQTKVLQNSNGKKIETNYTYVRPPLQDHEFQCEYVSRAVARCSQRAKSKNCLLAFKKKQ